jgi:4Fe-4S single cluster domain
VGIRLDGIHFLVTYRCTYACDHCFVWGSPDAEGTMTLAQLTSAIDQAADCGVVSVYFEGGEPTLAYPVVLAAAAHARRRGLEWGMVSNCFWATSVEDARVWLAPFVDLGISDLSLSSYAYFVEDADEDRLRNAALAAQELRLPMAVLEVGAAACLDIPGLCLGEDVGDIMCKGRAAVELAPGRAARPPDTLVSCPFEDFAAPGRAHLGCDGELQLCQGISAGNVFADGLAAVLEAYDPARRPVVAEIHAGGPWALARAYGHTPRRALYADECHLCYEVRSALRERLPDVLAPAQCYGLTAAQAAGAPQDQPA